MNALSQFIHLRVHTAYSLAESAVQIKNLPELCHKFNMPAVTMTDTVNLFGALEFSLTCAKQGIQPIIGAQLHIRLNSEDESLGQLLLLVQSELGYHNLIKLVSNSYLQVSSGEAPYLQLSDLENFSEGLFCLTGGANGLLGKSIIAKNTTQTEYILQTLLKLFDSRLYIELQRHGLEAEAKTEAKFLDIAYKNDIPLVATNEVFFPDQNMHLAHDALLCIADGRYISETNRRKETQHHYFKSADEMAQLFADIPEAIVNTIQIAKRIGFRPKPVKPMLPPYPVESGLSEEAELKAQALSGLELRLKSQVFNDKTAAEEKKQITQEYKERLEFELQVIIQMGFPGYFLIVADFIKWAKDQGIPVGPGRGSGAGSLVAWSLTITDMDPIRFGLIFERFLNPDRVSMPDFDIDFCQERRDEVIEYVCQKYGQDRVAQIITFGKLQARAVVRDVGRVLQMPYGQVDKLCKLIPNNPNNPTTLPEAIKQEKNLRDAIKSEESVKQLMDIGQKLEGLYRHASTHAAGIVIGGQPIDDIVPLYKDDKGSMPATQFSMKYVEEAGLLKFDFLGLKTLTVIENCCKLIRASGTSIDISKIPLDDAKTFKLLGQVKTTGVFQVESAGMRDVLKRMQPDRFEDLIALVALYRPGPMDDIPRYLACKHGEEEVSYTHPLLEPILKATYGVMVYQEQVMKIAQDLAGYSLGEADLLRRAMGKKIKAEMDLQRDKFIKGAITEGIEKLIAEQIFDQMAKFASYGFNKSHSAPYALLSYQTAYLKANYPHEFYAASMTLDIQNTDKLNVFRQDIANCDFIMLPPDINKSDTVFQVEQHNSQNVIRYGLAAIKNVGMAAMQTLVSERKANGPFKSITDFAERLDKSVNRRMLEKLIAAGALDCLQKERAHIMSSVNEILKTAQRSANEKISQQVSLFGHQAKLDGDEIKLNTAEKWDILEQLQHEFAALGFFLSAHPLDIYGKSLIANGISSSDKLKTNIASETIVLAGILLSKQIRQSKSGKKFAFIQFSDPHGTFEVAIFSETFIRTRELLEVGATLVAHCNIRIDEDDNIRLTAQDIVPIDNILNQSSQHVKFRITKATHISELCNILEKSNQGSAKLTLLINLKSKEVELTLPGSYTINGQIRAKLLALPGVKDESSEERVNRFAA